MAEPKELQLPLEVATTTDVGRLLQEVKVIADRLHQLKIRSGGHSSAALPKSSALLEKVVALNGLNLLHETDLSRLEAYLLELKDKAHRLHFSFAAEPSAAFLIKLMEYLRTALKPNLLITIGLEPNIGIGCELRTTNRTFDLSLRQNLSAKSELLLKELSKGASVGGGE